MAKDLGSDCGLQVQGYNRCWNGCLGTSSVMVGIGTCGGMAVAWNGCRGKRYLLILGASKVCCR